MLRITNINKRNWQWLKDGKISHALGLGRINMVKNGQTTQTIYTFNVILSNVSMTFFHRTRTNKSNLYGTTRARITKTLLKEQEQSWRHNSSRLQIILRSYSWVRDSVVLAPKTDI